MVKSIRRPLPVHQDRECGECSECCGPAFEIDDPGIAQHAKGEPCPQRMEAGCAAYQARPLVCRRFKCLWLMGWGNDELRPDRIGLIPTMQEWPGVLPAHRATGLDREDRNLTQQGKGLIYCFSEAAPGAAKLATDFLEQFGAVRPLVVRPIVDDHYVLAPVPWLEAWHAEAQRTVGGDAAIRPG